MPDPVTNHVRQAIEAQLRGLVTLPVPYRLARIDDPPDRLAALVAGDVKVIEAGVDCLEILVVAYATIGRHVDDRERWSFPVPVGHPYPAPQPSGAWMPQDAAEAWAVNWEPVPSSSRRFGDLVAFGYDHVGILLGATGTEAYHCHRTHGLTVHPMARLERFSTGAYRLRAEVAA